MFDENDMILPEGFDPNVDEQHFEEETQTPETEAPTTETTVPETDQTVETETAPETTAPTTEPIAQEPEIPQMVKVKYNGTERELTLDEARTYAQKGMNYDKIAGQSKEQGDRLARYESMAKMFGFDSAEAMMTQAEQNFVDTKVQDLVKAGNTEAMARFLVQQEMNSLKVPDPAATQQPATQTGLTPERKAELDEFNAAYPDVTKIPTEVFEMHRGGVKLKMAYDIYMKQKASKEALEKITNENTKAQSELTILKQNQAAAVKGPVTGTVGKAAPEEEKAKDPFLLGFDADRY